MKHLSLITVLLGLISGSLSAAPPLPVSLTTPDHCFFGRTIIVTGSASDPDDNLDYMELWARLSDQTPSADWERVGTVDVAGGSAEADLTWTPPGVGEYEFYLGVFDLAEKSHADQPAGQRYQYAYVTVESPQPIPKALKLSASVEVNSTATIAATAFDPDGNLKEMSIYYRFNNGPLTLINDNPIPVSGFYATARVDWTPAVIGNYTVQASVEDHDGYRNDASLGGAKYIIESVEVVKAGTSQGQGSGQSGEATGQSGGSAPVFRSVRTSEKVYRNEINQLWALAYDSDGDLDEVQFQYRYKASGSSQWGKWENIGSAVEVSGIFYTARSSWKPIDGQDYGIRATVTDEAGNSATRELTRSFEWRQGSPLVLSFTKPSIIYSHEPNALSARVKDATDNLDDVQFQYKGPSNTDWQNIGSAVESTGNHFFTAKVSWTPTQTGSYRIKVIVTDTSDNESPSYETNSFTVVSGKPVIVSVPTPSSVYRGVSKPISATVKDPSGNLKEVQFAYSKRNSDGTTWANPVNIGSAVAVSGGAGVEVVATKAWTPSATGTYKIRVTVSDEPGNSDSDETASFQVVERPPPPTAPRVSSITVPSTVYSDESNTISAAVTDVNGDLDEVQFQYDSPAAGTTWVDIGSAVSVSGSSDTASISWTPTQTGSHKIRVTVSDDSTSTSDGTRISSSFQVVVRPPPPTAPRVSSITIPSTVYSDESNTISAAVTDVNGDLDEVQFQYDSPAAGTTWVDIGSAVSVSGSSDTASISWTPTQTGSHKIRVTVSDDSTSTSDGTRTSSSFPVVVRPRKPVADSPSLPETVYQNEGNTLSASITDADGDLQSVQFQYSYYDTSLSTPAWSNWSDIGSAVSVSGSSDTAEVTWTPSIIGTYKIRYTVTDAAGNSVTSDESPQFTVVSGGIVVSLRHSATIYQNYYNYLSVRTTDPSGDLQGVQFQYDGPSAGTTWVNIGSAVPVTGEEDTAAVMWKPTVTGAHKIRATVTDASANSQSAESASLTVVPYTGSGSAGTASPRMVQGPLTVGNNQTHDAMHGSDIATSGIVTIENGGQSIFWSGGRIVLGDGFSADPTGDGFFNAIIDRDMDGLSDLEERTLGTDPEDYDSDDDGFSDGWENLLGFNPNMKDVPSSWTDNDTDGMPDSWEDYYSAKSALDSFWEDYDGDGLLNYVEFWAGTDPGPAMNGDSIDFDSPGLWKSSDYLDAKFPSKDDVVLLLIPEKGVYSMDETNTESSLSLVTADL